MDSAVSIFKWVQENKTVGNGRRMDDRRDVAVFHPLVGVNQPIHQILQIIRLRTDKMDDLFLIGDRLPDIILSDPIITILEPGVDNPVLKRYQSLFLTKLLFRCKYSYKQRVAQLKLLYIKLYCKNDYKSDIKSALDSFIILTRGKPQAES